MYAYWWGMTWFWWAFWVVLILAFAMFLVPVPRSRIRHYDDPLHILARRYAAGEITHEEYEERRARIERDLHRAPLPPPTPPRATPPVDTTTPQPT